MPEFQKVGDPFLKLDDAVYEYLASLQPKHIKVLGGRVFKVEKTRATDFGIRIEIAVKDPKKYKPDVKRYDYEKIKSIMGIGKKNVSV